MWLLTFVQHNYRCAVKTVWRLSLQHCGMYVCFLVVLCGRNVSESGVTDGWAIVRFCWISTEYFHKNCYHFPVVSEDKIYLNQLPLDPFHCLQAAFSKLPAKWKLKNTFQASLLAIKPSYYYGCLYITLISIPRDMRERNTLTKLSLGKLFWICILYIFVRMFYLGISQSRVKLPR